MRPIALALILFSTMACGPNRRILESAATPNSNSVSRPAASSFDQEVEAMRTANFNFIYVFRRKDGAPMDAADKKFAAERVPLEINRRKVIEDGRAIILGSNYRLPPENLAVLTGKFTFEDFSKPQSEIMNADANGNVAASK